MFFFLFFFFFFCFFFFFFLLLFFVVVFFFVFFSLSLLDCISSTPSMTLTPYTPSGTMTHAVSPSVTTETKTSIHNSCTLFFICVTIIIMNYRL